MNFFKYLFILLPIGLFAQVNEIVQDSTSIEYLIIEGDSIPRTAIDLDEVMLLHKLKFDSKEDRIRYLILRRKTIKVYPYAKLAAERLDSMNARMSTLKRARDKKRYTKRVQKYIEGEFSDELKKLTRTEGQILVKLIHRQTGTTAFDLIKELRSGWRAFWYNTTASMFDISLKREFDPFNEKEDYLIEDILQRNFQSGVLVRQDSAIKFDFFDLTNKWINAEEPKEK
ncbi:DUF4294 domain-containing protein [Sabulilitoribacter multivorans]|uniref:DUF4294 domain-containing protein n=1 Tax=Flaviramulus multivorans TaxID=1304750 RepID=A0ABS9IK13_9FLAO|nr:DUF4294 domain-containing protein [Flaviramulus multivorans]MCF7560925.1 DUF4294 domain-containing protein [Flaviramulus multivorans]